MDKFMKNLGRILFNLLLTVIVIFLVYIGFRLSKRGYVVVNCSSAKNYLIDKYEFDDDYLTSKKYTKYAYEDITDCSSLWFKECTSEKDLAFSYVFESKDGITITVKEDVNGKYFDDYKNNDENIKKDEDSKEENK